MSYVAAGAIDSDGIAVIRRKRREEIPSDIEVEIYCPVGCTMSQEEYYDAAVRAYRKMHYTPEIYSNKWVATDW